ncbi:dirigent protein 2-like [Salvia miltiorrhiza]|uniref:dirigent protein 2-like n=1 Tax=Salvia miltiorrhiza TaxID=226208 RepID=UPI0025AD8E0D|nr:dirigent protein 2-like [Salvia miltiorrhiza]
MKKAYLKSSYSLLPSHQQMATLLAFSLILLSTHAILTHAKFSEQSLETQTAHRAEKVSHLHFYFHDIVSGKNPTAIVVAGTRNVFGMTTIIDDPLTEGPEPGSKVVGRAQGVYTLSAKDGAALLMAITLVFQEGKYNGSSISILGSNQFLEAVREMPVVGGTGAFRFARGYALAKTNKFTVATGDAVVEYNVFVMHY